MMMVSRVPTYSIKRIRIEPHWVLPTLLSAFVVIAGLVVETWFTLCVVSLLYMGSIPFSVLAARRLRQREPAPAPAEAEPSPAAAEGERIVTIAQRQRPH
jgi:CDP-diacylglycerol---serine O-phosphatidyltransferase